jgi:hypothetical protein
MASRGQEVCGLIRGAPGGPRNVSSWHNASNRCGANVRTRSERSGHAASVGSGRSDENDPTETLAESKSRNAAVSRAVRRCAILLVGSTGGTGGETARVYHAYRRRGSGLAAPRPLTKTNGARRCAHGREQSGFQRLPIASEAYDPSRSSAGKFAVMHNIAPSFNDVVACGPQPEGSP